MIKLTHLQDYNLEVRVLKYLIKNTDIRFNLPVFFKPDIFYNHINIEICKVIQDSYNEITIDYEHDYIDISLLQKIANKNKLHLKEIYNLENYNTSQSIELDLKLLKELELKRRIYQTIIKESEQIDISTDIFFNIENIKKAIDVSDLFVYKAENVATLIDDYSIKKYEKIENYANGIKFGHATGFSNLDNLISGWLPSNLYIIAGRPSMGKTSIVLQLILNQTCNTLFYSLEMSTDSILDRLVQNQQDIQSNCLKTGKFTSYEISSFDNAIVELNTLENIYIDDFKAENKHIDNIRQKIRNDVNLRNIKVLFIDYLSLIKHSERDNNIGFGVVTKTLKEIAKELEISIVLLSQLNRNVENRSDKRPILADLRDSGEIEQDADVIGFIFREDYYTKAEGEDCLNQIEINIAKNREGDIGTIILKHNDTKSKFYEEMPY